MSLRLRNSLWYKLIVAGLFAFTVCFVLNGLIDRNLHPENVSTGHFGGDPSGLTVLFQGGVRLVSWLLSCLLFGVFVASGESRNVCMILEGIGVGVGVLLGSGLIRAIANEPGGTFNTEAVFVLSATCAVVLVVSMALVFTIGLQVRSFRKWLNQGARKSAG